MSFSSSLGDAKADLKKNIDGLNSDFQSQLNSNVNSKVEGLASPLPWQSNASKFFPYIKIKPERWDQLFPYRLVVVDTSKGNQIVNGTPQTQLTVKRDKSRTSIEFTPLGSQWIFTLPITPQQLTISDQYAINTTATLLGIVEEHSGVRFKTIQAQGTMGVWTYRENVTKPPESPGIIQSIFGGALESAGSVLGQVARTINTATSNHPAPKPVSKRPEVSQAGVTSTGYYQALALQQFLEQYAEAKKDPANKYWRLVLDIPKQNQSLVITPLPFVWQQSANKPMEITYSFQAKAWRRIDLNLKTSPKVPQIQPLSPGILQRILNAIQEARKTLSGLTDLIGAVRSDVTRPLEALRQCSLFVKDLAGVVLTAADMPFQLQRDFKYAINDFFKSLSQNEILKNAATDPAVAQALKDLKIGWDRTEGVSASSIRTGQLGPGAAQAQSVDPGLAVLDKPEKNHQLVDKVNIFALSLSESQQEKIDDAVVEARRITVDDLKIHRTTLNELALQLSNNFGAGSAYFNQVYGRPAPSTRIQPMTLDEYQILKVVYDAIQAIDLLTATTEIDDLKRKTNMEYVAGLAEEAGMPFNTTQAKILVPVPFGRSIEAIAARYLGDAQRWLEIVTLNNLRSPYIDENGFKLTLLSNASGRQITISNVENLYVGQRVVLRSSTQSPSARKILGIDRLSDTSFLITLDGEPDLENFVTADSAYVQAYLPGTVNSQQKIFIPSDLPVSNDPRIIVPTSVQSDPLVGLSKVDWLLTDDGDIAVNNYGDIRLSAGMTNLIQALKIKLGTRKGSVLLHPEFGLGIRPGRMLSDTDAQAVFDDINALVSEDSRFEGLDSLQVIVNGPTLTINMGVRLAGNNGVFPVAFDVPA